MTTPNTDLAEQIARALRRHDAETHGWSGPMLLTVTVQDYMPAAAAVLPIVKAEVRRAKATGWAHGYGEGFADAQMHRSHERFTNPYTEQEPTR